MDHTRLTEFKTQSQFQPNVLSHAPYHPVYDARTAYSDYHYYTPNESASEPSGFAVSHDTPPLYHYRTGIARSESIIHPSGVDSYMRSSNVALGGHSDPYAYQRQVSLSASPAAYYSEPNAHTLPDPKSVGVHVQSAAPRAAMMRLVNPGPPFGGKNFVGVHANIQRRGALQKTKIVQSVWCEICTIECSSKAVLDQHRQGKKHKKNLEKLKESDASSLATNSQKPAKESQGARKTEAVVDLDAKKRKLMEGGADPESVRACTICNIVCNSETVFNFHLAGQKHAAQLKKQTTSPASVAAA